MQSHFGQRNSTLTDVRVYEVCTWPPPRRANVQYNVIVKLINFLNNNH